MLLNMVMFKVTICDFGKMNINMTDKIEKKGEQRTVYITQVHPLRTQVKSGLVYPRWRYIVLKRIASKRPLLFDPKQNTLKTEVE